MTWNYRVFHEDNGDYVIREVYYDDDGRIETCTENPVEPMGSTLEELAQDIEWFKEALSLPVLTLTDIPPSNSLERRVGEGKTFTHEELLAELGLAEEVQ